jgi:hypothetical protein
VNELLNTAQRNSLTIGLRAFEMHLREADAWLQGREERGILYLQRADLPAERCAPVRGQIAAALAQIAALTERLGLEAVAYDVGATISAQMSVDWANLCDTRSDMLRRYGDVDPRLSELLDPGIDALSQSALLVSALGQGGQVTEEKSE